MPKLTELRNGAKAGEPSNPSGTTVKVYALRACNWNGWRRNGCLIGVVGTAGPDTVGEEFFWLTTLAKKN